MTPILYRIPLQKSMVKLPQFVSRNIMTRDKMSQPLVAWCLVLVACSFFYFLEKAGACTIGGYNHIRPCVPYVQTDFQESTIAPPSRENVAALTDPRSLRCLELGHPVRTRDQ